MVTGERIQGDPPLLGNKKLASYSTGLFNEEGYSYCKRRTGRRAGGPSRTIAITMCDKDALGPLAKWWGLQVRPRGGVAITCVDGPAYRIEASGFRAELIINEMMKYGLSKAKVRQWRKVVRHCRNKKSSRRKHPSHRRMHCLRLPLEGGILARYSTGLFNGGGCSYAWKSGKYWYPRIQVGMCDKDALEPVGKWWAAHVRSKGEKVKVCVGGPAYQIALSGARTLRVVDEMIKYGLSDRKIEQWRKVLSQCERPSLMVPR